MLRVGLTGGIGSGKSTAAHRFALLGAVLVDSDVLAREAVAPGTDGLTEVVAAFGDGVVGPDGALDRPALAAIVFADPRARERLNAVVHPRVRDRTEALVAAAGPDAIVVQDVPLLVETGSPAAFALVVVVHADAETRVRRLVEARGMSADDARARIAAQADDAARRAAADVWLDNSGAPGDLEAAVDGLWHRRLVPFAANLRDRRPVLPASADPVAPDPGWAAAGRGSPSAWRGRRVPPRAGRRTSARPPCPGCPPPTSSTPTSPSLRAPTRPRSRPGWPPPGSRRSARTAAARYRDGPDRDGTGRGSGRAAGEWWHAGADPGRPVRVRVSRAGSPAWRAALLEREWLRADAAARARYIAVSTLPGAAGDAARRHFAADAVTRAEDWAASSGWSPSLDGTGHPDAR